MRAVNLLPRDGAPARGPRRPNRAALIGIGAAAAVLAALVAAVGVEDAKVRDKRRQLESLQAQLAIARPRAKPAGDPRLAKEQEQRLTALGAALSGRIAWDRILRKLALVLPEDVWLSGLTAASPTSSAGSGAAAASPPAPGAESAVSIKGYTYSHEAVARFLARLAVVPELTNVQLQKSGRTKVGERPVVEFGISANVRLPGAAS